MSNLPLCTAERKKKFPPTSSRPAVTSSPIGAAGGTSGRRVNNTTTASSKAATRRLATSGQKTALLEIWSSPVKKKPKPRPASTANQKPEGPLVRWGLCADTNQILINANKKPRSCNSRGKLSVNVAKNTGKIAGTTAGDRSTPHLTP